jgi:hypothetical protein
MGAIFFIRADRKAIVELTFIRAIRRKYMSKPLFNLQPTYCSYAVQREQHLRSGN